MNEAPSHSKNIVISTFHGRAEHLSFTPKINYTMTQLLKTRYKMFFLNIKAVERPTNENVFKKMNNLAQLLIHKVKTNKKIFLYYICIELELCNSLLVLISFKLLTVLILYSENGCIRFFYKQPIHPLSHKSSPCSKC